MKIIASRPQRTLADSVEIDGVGLISGAPVHVRLRPAAADSGIVFVRTDLPGKPQIPAKYQMVADTHRRTKLGKNGVSVALVEHLLAALAGMRIDNCTVELDAEETPALDGSALGYVEMIQQAGVEFQDEPRQIWAVDHPVSVARNGATLVLHPPKQRGLVVTYHLDYGAFSPIGQQRHTLTVTPESFANELAPCRTFLLKEEAELFQRQGWGASTKITDLVVFDKTGPIQNELYFADEPARHKVLDVIGDLSLLGHEVFGHIVGYRSGHPLNVELVRELGQRMPRVHQCRRAA